MPYQQIVHVRRVAEIFGRCGVARRPEMESGPGEPIRFKFQASVP